jgi:hypothetical protein
MDIQSDNWQLLRSFLRRKSNMVLIFGSLLVFASFIVRDEMRDDLKDISSAIAQAQSDLDMRTSLSAILESVEGVQQVAEQISSRQISNKARSLGGDHMELLNLQSQGVSIGMQTNALSSFVEQLPNNADLTSRIVQFQKHFDAMTARTSDATKRISEVEMQNVFTMNLNNHEEELNNNYVIPITMAWATLAGELAQIQTDAVKRAKEVQATRDLNYRIVNWLSIVLFALGWAFGLFTKLMGVDSESATD